MTIAGQPGRSVRGVVLDVEGTTTPVSFVYDVLFPYARAHLRQYVSEHANDAELRESVSSVREERLVELEVPQDDSEGIVAYAERLMDLDRKSPGLKRLQGLIWRGGYEDGTLRGDVYDDVPRALRRWRARGRAVAIYSSGSVLAQRLLFANSTHGDLTTLIDRHFDTDVGPKRSTGSYAKIAESLGCRGEELLFVSDVVAELDAARGAGFDTRLCVRGDETTEGPPDAHIIRSLDEIE